VDEVALNKSQDIQVIVKMVYGPIAALVGEINL
jgi:hypothetical protein